MPTLYIGEYYLHQKANSPHQAKMISLTKRYRADYLKRVARALSRYSERALGPQHELTSRARALSRHAAQTEEEGSGSTTNLEEGLRYTWELVRLGR